MCVQNAYVCIYTWIFKLILPVPCALLDINVSSTLFLGLANHSLFWNGITALTRRSENKDLEE